MANPLNYAVTRLTLTDFRNYAGLRIEPRASLIVLTGANGSGKTNLLEAISLLAAGRGLRGVDYPNLARLGAAELRWAVSAECLTPHGSVQIGTAWQAQTDDAASAARTVMVDGLPRRGTAALAEGLRMLWLTPAMDRLFSGSPGDRRRFLDRMVSLLFPDHASHVSAFERLMRERNVLLEDHTADAAWMASLELQMAEAGAAIAHARLECAAVLGSHLAAAGTDAVFPWASLSVTGSMEELVADRPAVQAEEDYRERLARNRSADRAAGRALLGPHRSDMKVVHGPKGMAAENCSTGEQKALLIGLVLAQASAVRSLTEAAPMLLLDEVAAHLDITRRQGLFARLASLGSQVWMTGTDPQFFDGISGPAVVYHIENGSVLESHR